MSVARSLAKRDGFDLEKGYYLWLEHMLSTLMQTEKQTRIVVDYDRLMDDPAGQLRRMAQSLGLNFDPAGPEFIEYRTQFLEDSLRHILFRMEDLHLDKAVPPGVIPLYKVFVELAGDNIRFDHPDVIAIVNSASAQLRDNYSALSYMQSIGERLAACTRQNVVLKQTLAASEQRAQSAEAELFKVLSSHAWRMTAPLRRLVTRWRERE
jgi:hypothetical protein